MTRRIITHREFEMAVKLNSPHLTVEGKYENARTKHKYICDKGHVSSCRANALMRGVMCNVCWRTKPTYIKDPSWFYQQLAEKNPKIKLLSSYTGMSKEVKYRCSNGHVHTTKAHHLISGHDCGPLHVKVSVERLVDKIKSSGLKINVPVEKITIGKPIPLICPRGHVFERKSVLYTSRIECPMCTSSSISNPHKILAMIFQDKAPLLNDRSVLEGKELDLFFSTSRLGIEVNGNFWHANSKTAHVQKFVQAEKQSVKLLHFWEDEIQHKLSAVLVAMKRRLHTSICIDLNQVQLQVVGTRPTITSLCERVAEEYVVANYREHPICALGVQYHRTFGPDKVELVSIDFAKSIRQEHLLVNRMVDLVRHRGTLVAFDNLRLSESSLLMKLGLVQVERYPPEYDYVKGMLRVPRTSLKNTDGFSKLWDCGWDQYYEKGVTW